MYLEQQIIDFTTEHQCLTKAVITFVLTIGTYFAKKYIFKNFVKKIVEKTPTSWDNEFYPLIDSLSSILIWVIGIGYVLIDVGVDIKTLIQTVGASSILILYACKDTLANIIAGLVIKADRPFREGDYMILPSGEDVVVLKIGLRRSRFLSMKKEKNDVQYVITVPNVDLAKNKIKNLTYAEEL